MSTGRSLKMLGNHACLGSEHPSRFIPSTNLLRLRGPAPLVEGLSSGGL